MLNNVTRYAHWIDLWLRKHVGRPYTTVLVIGLMLSIGASATSLSQAVEAGGQALLKGDVAKTVAGVVFQAALLVNQLAQLDEHRARRRRRRMRAQEKGRVAAASAER